MKIRCIRVLVAVALALGAVAVPSGAAPVHAAVSVCSGWTNTVTPPPTIRVYRHTTRTTAIVDFRAYVETVMASEWGARTTAAAMRAGAVAVKQYAWYYAMHWRGGKDAKHRCYDVTDTSTDQLYNPSRKPSALQLAAVAATWSVSLRKGDSFFLTGYRGGNGRCLSEIDGWRLYQADAVNCIHLYRDTTETLLRRFYSNLSVTTPGSNDATGDHRGDAILAITDPVTSALSIRVLTSDPAWSTALVARAGRPVAPAQTGTVIGQGSGDVNGDGRTDLVRLVSTGTAFELQVLVAGDRTFGAPVTWWSSATDPAGAPPEGGDLRLVVGDFNGDGRADAGLIRLSPTDTRLMVAISTGAAFAPSVRRLTVAEPLLAARFIAADFTGDGRADLAIQSDVTPDGGPTTVVTRVATSSPTQYLAAPAAWGSDEPVTLARTMTLAADIDRNGKDDLVIGWRAGDGTRFLFYRSTGAAFTRRWATAPLPGQPFAASRLVSADWNGDGRSDIVAFRDLGAAADGTPLGTAETVYLSSGNALTPQPLRDDPTLDWDTFSAN